MHHSIPYVYYIISMVIITFNVIIAVKSFKQRNKLGQTLGQLCIFGIMVTIFYMFSSMAENEFVFSIFSSLHFISVDLLVVYLVVFAVYFTKKVLGKKWHIIIGMTHGLFLIDAVIFIINIFTNISISYKPVEYSAMSYGYVMHAPYVGHLVFDYILIVIALGLFIYKMVRLPWEYKKPYIFIISGVIVVVMINAMWLYAPSTHLWSNMDYSVWGYSIAEYFMYWTCFMYNTRKVPNFFRNAIVDSIDQGVVLFSIDDKMILCNDKAKYLLDENYLQIEAELSEFLKKYPIDFEGKEEFKTFTTQVVAEKGGRSSVLRCDVHVLENKQHKILGKLFVFSDAVTGIDLMTGFHTLESFNSISEDRKELFSDVVTIVIIDMIGLKAINYNEGRAAGDKKIKQLANVIQKIFPQNTFLVRGQDANLMAVCNGLDEKQAREFVDKVIEAFDGKIQFSISAKKEAQSLSDAIVSGERALSARKLMDKQSHHSEVLTSLLVALQECDHDTEKHVERTQEMGSELGKRINLSEVELSELSLLCILHDIGKIGIPMDILNKPGKLTDDEWVIMRSHVEKGHQIASSNQEFKEIANMVRSHHERWDGKGYPDGLKGEEIPKLSRVISIVDSYDAMVNDRIYRPAMAPEKAQAEILKCAGSQFDPYIAKKFVEMLQEPKYKEISDKITEKVHKRESDEKKRTAERNRMLANKGEDGNNIITHDYARLVMKADGTVIFGDEKFSALSGYEEMDWKESTLYLSNLIFEEDFKSYVEKVSRRVRTGELSYFTFRIKCKDGSARFVPCVGRLFYDSTRREERGELIFLDDN